MRFRNFAILLCLLVAILGIWRTVFHVEIVNAHPRGTNVIAFGDSLVAGFGAEAGEDFPSQLSQMAGLPVINRGVAGETSGDALRRLDRDVLQNDPRIVIVCLGGNDLLQHLPLDQTFANLDQIVRRIQEKGAMVVLVGIKGLIFTDTYGPEYKKLAATRGALLVPNILGGIISDPKLKSDQIHPNGKGYKIMAQRIYGELKGYL